MESFKRMSSDPRSPKLRQALRTAEFKGTWRELRDCLETTVGLPTNISEHIYPASVELADQLTAAIIKLRHTDIRDIYRCNEVEFVKEAPRILRKLGRQITIALPHWPQIGAFEVSTRQLAATLVPLMRFDGDGVAGCSADRSRVFSFDFDADYGEGQEYEVVVGPWSHS